MKKIIIFAGSLCLLTSFSAHAGISVDIGIPLPTYYATPVEPVYAAPSYVQYGDYGGYRYRHDHRRYEDRRPHR